MITQDISVIFYKVGIVIVNYNRGKLVREMVQLFSRYDTITQIVIVDNCSTDDSRVLLRAIEKGKVKCIYPGRNEGYARGNNIGIKFLREECKCDYCFIVNPDVFFEENVIKSIVDAFEQHSEFAILTCARIDPLSTIPHLQYTTRVFDTFWLQFLSYFNVARHYYLLKRYGVYQYDASEICVKQIAVAPGSFFGIRMSTFPDGMILDEGTFLYGEEDLLAMRCRQLGVKEGFLSNVVYEHRHIQHSTTLSHKSIAPIKLAMRSKRYFQQKYLTLNLMQRIAISIAEKISLFERFIIMYIN